jgi:NADH-quinone oxidoreductase chain I
MWGTGILNGFVITIRNMFRPVITVQYPEQKLTLPPRARWAVRHRFNDDGTPKCTACLICVRECPDHVLRLESSVRPEGGKHIDRYVYEVGACMMCGLCVAACPFDAIEMSHEYELATIDHDDLVRVLLRDVDAAGPRRAAAVAPAPEAPVTPAPAPEAPKPEEGTDA